MSVYKDSNKKSTAYMVQVYVFFEQKYPFITSGGDRKQFDPTEAKTPNTSFVPPQNRLSLLS